MTVDLEAIRKRHRKAHSSWLGDYCVECGEWPCDAAVLADEVERLRRCGTPHYFQETVDGNYTESYSPEYPTYGERP